MAQQETDENSVLNFYRRAVQLRRQLSCVKNGNYKEYGKLSSAFYTYSREDENEKLLAVCSFTGKAKKWSVPAGFDLSDAEVLLTNHENTNDTLLQPYETRVYYWKK